MEEYLKDGNATAAYQRAGYKVKDANVAAANASRLLGNAKVSEAVKNARSRSAERAELSQSYVLRRLQDNVERAMQAEPVTDREGNPTGEYTYQGGVANRALELLGKHLGMFKEQVDHSGTVEVHHRIDLTKLTDEQLDQLEAIVTAAEQAGDPGGEVPPLPA